MSGTLSESKNIEVICDGVHRVLASNPKDYTGKGTNAYVVGDDRVWIIDPGPADTGHVNNILTVVNGRPVDGIFITHTHLDHSPAAELLKQETKSKTYGFGALSADILSLTTEDVDSSFVPDVALRHKATIGSGDWELQALHTPGHFPNHMCYYLPKQSVLFSGDHVMGWSTTVIVPPLGSLLDYMESLNILEHCDASLMLPSHGDEVGNPNVRIDEVRQHRKMRHSQVKACMSAGKIDPAIIVEEIYEGLSPRLVEAAKGSVMAHMEVIELEAESREQTRNMSDDLVGMPKVL